MENGPALTRTARVGTGGHVERVAVSPDGKNRGDRRRGPRNPLGRAIQPAGGRRSPSPGAWSGPCGLLRRKRVRVREDSRSFSGTAIGTGSPTIVFTPPAYQATAPAYHARCRRRKGAGRPRGWEAPVVTTSFDCRERREVHRIRVQRVGFRIFAGGTAPKRVAVSDHGPTTRSSARNRASPPSTSRPANSTRLFRRAFFSIVITPSPSSPTQDDRRLLEQRRSAQRRHRVVGLSCGRRPFDSVTPEGETLGHDTAGSAFWDVAKWRDGPRQGGSAPIGPPRQTGRGFLAARRSWMRGCLSVGRETGRRVREDDRLKGRRAVCQFGWPSPGRTPPSSRAMKGSSSGGTSKTGRNAGAANRNATKNNRKSEMCVTRCTCRRTGNTYQRPDPSIRNGGD